MNNCEEYQQLTNPKKDHATSLKCLYEIMIVRDGAKQKSKPSREFGNCGTIEFIN
jgi:hypothetical protein